MGEVAVEEKFAPPGIKSGGFKKRVGRPSAPRPVAGLVALIVEIDPAQNFARGHSLRAGPGGGKVSGKGIPHARG